MLPADRPGCSCSAIRTMARASTRFYDAMLASSELRLAQFALLANLDRHGAVSTTALARILAMDRTTLSRNLAPLRRDGLLSLDPSGAGRTKLVALTARGRKRLLAAYPLWREAERRFTDLVGADAIGHLHALAGALAAR